MTSDPTRTQEQGAEGVGAGRVPAYEEWEDVTRNEPRLSSVQEPLTLSMLTGPGPGLRAVRPEESDLTRNSGTDGEAIGQRIIISGRTLDETGAPIPGVVIEIWQANAAGRYAHELDSWSAPTDPNFLGRGRCVSDEDGEYQFVTIRPGAYPWKIETNEWRPAHIHLSIMGPSLAQRLVTQVYFRDDPHFGADSIFGALSEDERDRVILEYDHSLTQPDWAMGYRFDIILRGPLATPAVDDTGDAGDER